LDLTLQVSLKTRFC